MNAAATTVDDAHRKAVATLTAEFALQGWTLAELADGAFVAGRWGHSSTPLADVAAVRAFAQRAGIRIDDAA